MDVTIADNNKLQFYLEEIYDSNNFDKQEMLTWEQQPALIKTNFDQTKAYLEQIVKATNVYKQNSGGSSARGNKYESANQMANIGDELRKWIQQIASNGANNKQAVNAQATKKIASMEAEINKLTATISQMASKMNNNKNSNLSTGSGDHESQHPQMKKAHNMGVYCHSHGFHPIGTNHTSATCSWKKDGHKVEAMWTNCLGGNMFWPTAKCVAINQQYHATLKSKSAPTN